MKLLYGIGVGPGDPELLTVKAIRVLREADYVFVPRPKMDERGMAEAIVADYLDANKVVYLHFPMGPDNAERYKETARRIDAAIQEGECGAFITIGDPMVYSTFTYVMFEARKCGLKIEIVPGISSSHAAAAALQWPLTIKQESSYLADGHVDEDVLRRVQSVCVLKPRKEPLDTLNKLEEQGFEYAYIKRCSLPEQEILRDREAILNDKEYMTLLFARKRRER